jgi:hypothetical protein
MFKETRNPLEGRGLRGEGTLKSIYDEAQMVRPCCTSNLIRSWGAKRSGKERLEVPEEDESLEAAVSSTPTSTSPAFTALLCRVAAIPGSLHEVPEVFTTVKIHTPPSSGIGLPWLNAFCGGMCGNPTAQTNTCGCQGWDRHYEEGASFHFGLKPLQ